MGKRKAKKELEPMPMAGRVVVGIVLFSFICLTLLTGKFYLHNWRGDTAFLPFVLLIGLLLIVVIVGSRSGSLERVSHETDRRYPPIQHRRQVPRLPRRDASPSFDTHSVGAVMC